MDAEKRAAVLKGLTVRKSQFMAALAQKESARLVGEWWDRIESNLPEDDFHALLEFLDELNDRIDTLTQELGAKSTDEALHKRIRQLEEENRAFHEQRIST